MAPNRRSRLTPAGLERTGLFREGAAQRILDADSRSSAKKSAGKRTWLLVLHAWHELYVNGNDRFFVS